MRFFSTLKCSAFLFSLLLSKDVLSNDNLYVNGLYFKLDTEALQATVVNGDYSSLTNANIPECISSNDILYEVVGIEECCFKNCESLKELTIPKTLKTIDNESFNGCTGLKKIIIEDGNDVLSMGYNTYHSEGWGKGLFADCPLEELYLGRNLDYRSYSSYDSQWGFSPFANTPLSKVSIGDKVTTISRQCFRNTKSSKIVLPNSVKFIADMAFMLCENLSEVQMSDNIETIGGWCFYGCAFEDFSIPSKVKYIGANAFAMCKKLKSIVIPKSVTIIGDGGVGFYSGCTFSDCSSLQEIIFEESDKPIIYCNYYQELWNVKSVFLGRQIEFNNGSENPRNTDSSSRSLFRNVNKVIFGKNFTEIPDYFFWYCSELETITLPNTITSIGSDAFENCSKLMGIRLPNHLNEIKTNTFSCCYDLKEITIPTSVSEISSTAFWGCNSLASVICLNPTPFSLNQYVFQGLDKSAMTLYVPINSVTDYQNANIWKQFGNIEAFCRDIKIGTSGKATYCSDYDLDFTGVGGMKAYVATGFNHDNGSILLTRIYQIPSGTGFMLVGNPGTYEIPVADVNYSYANLFAGTLEATEVPMTADGYTHYILANGSSGVMFYKYAGGTLSANKAYLRVPSSEATTDKVKMRFSDDPTTVDMIDFGKEESDVMFNLKGQRIYEPQKGIYIKNGKTYVK